MTVRSIDRAELDRFAAFGPEPTRVKAVALELWDDCQSCPEWSFVAERNGGLVGRVAYWILPSMPDNIHCAWLELDWTGDYLAVGRALFEQSLGRMKSFGASRVEAALDSDQDHLDERRRLFRAAGLELFQDKQEYLLTRVRAGPPGTGRLSYRSLPELGEQVFRRALWLVTQGTLDREDRSEIARCTPDDFGRWYSGILRDIDCTPERWRLAYLADSRLCGLIAPQMLNCTVGAINYIGVIPELRGRGYVAELLAEGIRLLAAAGAERIVASIDTVNRPMLNAAVRAGFEPRVLTRILRRDLARPVR
jgi:RimJ/RimL family protein N-acetyltransferase